MSDELEGGTLVFSDLSRGKEVGGIFLSIEVVTTVLSSLFRKCGFLQYVEILNV